MFYKKWLFALIFPFVVTEAQAKPDCKSEIVISGTITQNTFLELRKHVQECGQKGGKINIVLNSEGGNVVAGIAIYDLLVNSQADVTTTIYGEASSSASLVFLAGKIRNISCNSYLSIHEATYTISEKLSEDGLREKLGEIVQVNNSIARIYEAATGKNYRKVMKEGLVMDGHKALELGFATKVTGSCKK